MSEPIISPWLIFFADMCDSISIAFCLFAFACFIYGIFCYTDGSKSGFYFFCWAMVFSLVMIAIIPSTKTIYKMFLAQKVTRQTISDGVDVYERIKSDLINGIVLIQKEKETNGK